MKKSAFVNALGTLAYIMVVATIMQNGDRLFGEMDNFLGPIAFLLLFVLSAIVVGSLVLGKPLTLYLDGKKKEAVQLFLSTATWLAGFTAIALLVALILK